MSRRLRAVASSASVGASPIGQGRDSAKTAIYDSERLAMLKWHLDRSDRLRSSTASRASVVLSAGAILSAGNAVLLGQILGRTSGWLSAGGWLAGVTVAVVGSAALVVLSLIKAANVLLTTRGSRRVFRTLGDVPPGLIFNNADTVEWLKTFDEFHATTTSHGPKEMADAAEVELRVCIHQHRHRYTQLRSAVRLLRYAALSFLGILIAVMVANLAYSI